jgi:hypothetical protein
MHFARLTLERIDEDTERAKINRFLATAPALGGQSAHASATHCHWLCGAAERRERMAQSDLIGRLADVERYLHAHAGSRRDWFGVVEHWTRAPTRDPSGNT